MKPRFVVHIGAPKTGTTYLQSLSWANVKYLEEAGVFLPGEKQQFHFRAGGDLYGPEGLERTRGPNTKGMWKRFSKVVRKNSHPVVMLTDERLAGAPHPAPEMVAELADVREIHVVYGVRNLASLLPSAWNTQVRHGLKKPFEDWIERILNNSSTDENKINFWQRHDVPHVVARWSKAVADPSHFHVITVPKRSDDPDLLWKRFAKAGGLPDSLPEMQAPKTNTTLGYPQVEFLRRLNVEVADELTPGQYRNVVRNLMSNRMSEERIGDPPRMPARFEEPLAARAAEIIDYIDSADCDFVGDLTDLVPEIKGTHKAPKPKEVLDASVTAMSQLIRDLSERRW